MFKKFAAVFAICLTLAGCGVSQESYDQAVSERDALATQVAELQTENDTLNTQINQLRAENNTLTTQNATLNSENASLSSENASLKANPAAESVPSSAGTSTAPQTLANGEESGAAAAPAEQYTYIGNKNSHKFHRKSCSTLPAEENRIYYATRDEAINDGMVPCKRCDP